MCDKNCRENQGTHFIFSNFFLKMCHSRDVEKYGTARQVTDDGTTRHRKDAIFMPHN